MDHIASIQPFYWPKYREINASERRLRNFLAQVNSVADERIIELVKKLHKRSDSFMKIVQLQQIISDYGAHLFDLHILRKILMSKSDHCMVIAGNLHCEWICEAMEQMGAQYQMTVGARLRPLEVESFNTVQAALGLTRVYPSF